jgi:GTP-binding protein YchF
VFFKKRTTIPENGGIINPAALCYTGPVNFTLFGYPKTGKTTLFDILTGARVETAAYADGAREAHEKIRPWPDARLDAVARLYPDKKKVEAAVLFIDLAGISYGDVKNSVFLNALRKADGLVHVVRGFQDENIPRAQPGLDPRGDIRAMEDELVLADLISVETRLEKLDKDLKKMKSPEGEKEQEVLRRLHHHLGEGRPLRDFPWTDAEEKLVRSFAFLSQKPILHMINADETEAGRLAELESRFPPASAMSSVLAFCGKIEREISECETDEDKRVFRAEYGLAEPTPNRFFALAGILMKTIFFYTVGKNEVRAWPVRSSSSALEAAGSIHSDIEHGFIRAEVIPWSTLVELGALQAAKDRGAIRLEGRDYTVGDGDVIYFRFAA